MSAPLRLLFLEDSPADADLAERELRREGIDFVGERVVTEEQFVRALDELEPDAILADYSLPSFDGLSALRIVRQRSPLVPFLFVTGSLGEERAVEALKEGATDYVLKDRLQRLPTALLRACRDAADARHRERAQNILGYRMRIEEIVTRFSSRYIENPAAGLDDAIHEALEQIAGFLDADRSYLFLFSAGRQSMSNTHEWCQPGVSGHRNRLQNVPVSRFPWLRERFEGHDPVRIDSVSDLPAEASAEKEEFALDQIQSLLLVPMISNGNPVGFLGLDAVRRRIAWDEDAVALLRIAGNILGSAIVRHNVEKALAQERDFVSRVLEIVANPVMVLDTGGRLVRINEAFTDLTGYTEGEALGKSFRSLLDERKVASHSGSSAILSRGHSLGRESSIRTKQGEERLLLWRAGKIRSGNEEYVVISGVDLTELGRAERERLRLQTQLDQVQRIESLGRLAATMTHEFNNVLMGIAPNIELVNRLGSDDLRIQRAVELIRNSVRRGTKITSEILRFTRPLQPALRPIRVAEWLAALSEEMRATLGPGVDLQIRLDEPDLSLRADPVLLEQVIINLLLNARDAMEGPGRIELSAERPRRSNFSFGVVPGAHRFVHLAVVDEGRGIPDELRERIFEPLFTTKRTGTGLGLAVSHQIIRAHGGHVFVESRVGEGTGFHLFLPIGREEIAPEDQPAD